MLHSNKTVISAVDYETLRAAKDTLSPKYEKKRWWN